MSDLLEFVRGCTFDDFLFTPQYSVIERRDPAAIDLSCQLTTQLRLRGRSSRPTWTRSRGPRWRSPLPKKAASASSTAGFAPATSSRRFARSSASSAGSTASSRTRTRSAPMPPLTEAANVMQRTGVGTLVVVDESRRIVGLLTTRDLRFSDRSKTVSERMTPRDRLVVREGATRRRCR